MNRRGSSDTTVDGHAVLIGDVELLPLPDAVGLLAEYTDAYPDVPAEHWKPYRRLYPYLFEGASWRLPVNVYVIRAGETTILVDTGVGPPGQWTFWTPEQEGLLPMELARRGGHPEDVDIVFLSHLHVDHLGWNTDENAVPLFPRARYVVHRDAFEFAWAQRERSHIARCVGSLVDRFELLDDATEIAPGISAEPAPGHYPGFMTIRIVSNGDEGLILGDVAPHPALLDRPEWVFAFDEDSAENTATRRKLVAELVDSDILVACGHYPGSGIGRVVTRGDRIVWDEA